MLDVFFTVDVEVWCDGWEGIDEKFPRAFRTYVYGPTPRGDFALPYTLEVLKDHGITGVFFVEPLFATRFGLDPLAEIIGLIRAGGQEVQLHMHTEWVDEARERLLDGIDGKRQFLHCFDRDEQAQLIAAGKRLVMQAGGPQVNAFRAGSFGFNADTLRALTANGIAFDSSYDATLGGPESGVLPGTLVTDAMRFDGVCEFPMTVFLDSTGGLRHAQLTACSFREIEGLLWQALEAGRKSFVILSHNFELLNCARTAPDPIVVERYRKLCAFLERNRDSFRTRGFDGPPAALTESQPAPLASPIWRTAGRMVEQVYRRRYG